MPVKHQKKSSIPPKKKPKAKQPGIWGWSKLYLPQQRKHFHAYENGTLHLCKTFQFLTAEASKRGRVEGNLSSPASWMKRARFCDILTLLQPKSVLEVGFNAGHSAAMIMAACPALERFRAFDLGAHDYVVPNFEHIRQQWPAVKCDLIIGDSRETLPKASEEDSTAKGWDIIHIDGGHSFEVALADITNCQKLAHENTVVIIDDCNLRGSGCWLQGSVLKATNTAIRRGIIEEIPIVSSNANNAIVRYKNQKSSS